MKIAKFSNQADDPGLTFENILSDIRASTDLEELYLRGNQLTSTQIVLLAEALSFNKSLNTLDLSANGGNAFEENKTISSLKTIISEHPNLTFVNLSYNKMGDSTLKALVENNSNPLNAKILSVDFDLSCTAISEKAILIIDEKLSPSSNLSILSGNFTPTDVESVDKYRSKNLTKPNEENNNMNKTTSLNGAILES